MAVPVDYDQVRIMDHWLGENRKEPNFCGIAPKHYLADPSRLERAYDALVAYERAFEAPYFVILGDCHQGNTYILPTRSEAHTSELQSIMSISSVVFCFKK